MLLDVDPVKGKLSRRHECDADKTNHTTVENVFRGHGGWVTGDSKGLASFVTLQSTRYP